MKSYLRGGLAVTIICLSLAAAAQQSGSSENTKERDDTTAQQSSSSEAEVHVNEKITVTGQKIEQTIQETKESVVVFTEAVLEDRNLYELADVFSQTPGVNGDQFGFRIRGVRNSDGAAQPNRADLASVVVDGVTTSGWVKSETIGQLWDVSQVEVLRGPQSTNLGRNALAGAVVVNSNDPVYRNEGKLRAGFGEYSATEYKAVANINLVDGVSAIRFAGDVTQSDGFVNNVTRNEDDYAGVENATYRLKWLFEPSSDLRTVFSYQRLDNELGSTSTFFGEFDREDRAAIADADAIFDTKADLASFKINYAINDRWDLTSISSYQDGERVRFNDADQTAASVGAGGGVISRFSEDTNWSQELRFNYTSGRWRGSSGVFVSGIEARRSQDNLIDLNLPTLFDDFAPGLGAALTTTAIFPIAIYEPFYDTRQSGFTNVDTSTWAVFTEWETEIGDKWTASFGVRFDNEEQDFATASTTTSNYVLPATGGPFGAVDLGGITVDEAIQIVNSQLIAFTMAVPESQKTEDFNNVLPHAGITYDWSDRVSTSFFVTKSYRSGGSELTLFSGVNNFDAEELWNYETSLRAVILDGRGVFNTNLYYSDWTDQQVAVQEPGTTNSAFLITVNAGESTLYGAELSFDYELTNSLDLYIGAALSETEYDDFRSADGTDDFSGNDFNFAPAETGVLGLTYVGPSGLFLNGTATYTGSSFSTVENDLEMDSYTLINVNAGYAWDQVKFEAFGRNLTDETYDTNNNIRATDGTPGSRLGAPREVGARVTVSF